MPQQINLCTPILLAQKRYFSAQTMVQALAVFLLAGGALAAYAVWSLQSASRGFQTAMEAQARDLENLQGILRSSKEQAGPARQALTQDLASRQAELALREKLLADLRRGIYPPGAGPSARLRLVAQSTPAQLSVTALKVEDHQLEISGLTPEPSAVNGLVRQLAASPLLKGQRLASLKVESAAAPKPAVPGSAAGAAPAAARALWSFHLVSAQARYEAPVGGKP